MSPRSDLLSRTMLGLAPISERVVGDLAPQDLQLLLRRSLLHRRRIEKDDQDPCPLDVTEELVTETLSRSCALDQTRDVGHDELPPIEAHHTQDSARES